MSGFSLVLCLGGIFAVLGAARLYGRRIAVLAAATCGVSAAYVMPPAFSMQVSGVVDKLVLIAYGALSLVVVLSRFTKTRDPGVLPAGPGGITPSHTPASTPLSEILFGLVPPSVNLSIADMNLRSDPRAATSALREILLALPSLEHIEKLSIYGGRWPGADRIWVAARYRSLPEEPCVLLSGSKDVPGASVTSFDNGFERVYQVSLQIR